MNKYKYIQVLCVIAVTLSMTACSNGGGTEITSVQETTAPREESTEVSVDQEAVRVIDYDNLNTNKKSSEVNFGSTTTVELGENTVVTGNGAWYADDELTISSGGEYILSGTLNGHVYIETDENVMLTLAGVTITSSDSSAIYCYNAKNLYIKLSDETVNTISDGSSYNFGGEKESAADNEPNACIFSKSDLIFCGNGFLTVNGNYNNGVTSKDDLTIESGNITVNAVNNGITGKDSLVMESGSLSVKAAGDAIRSTNDTEADKGYVYISDGSLELTSEEDAVQAETDLIIDGGSFIINTTGTISPSVNEPDFGGRRDNNMSDVTDEYASVSDDTESDTTSKGIKCGGNMTISGGDFKVSTTDHCFHSQGTMTITGGSFSLDSSTGKGISSHGDLLIKSGTINITQSSEGIESKSVLQIDGGTIHINSSDDGLNTGGNNLIGSDTHDLIINGGYIYINASGDGIDSNGNITVNGGTVLCEGPTNGGNGALDCGDGNNEIIVNGGTLLALGSLQMAENPSESSVQNCLCVTFDSTLKAGTTIRIEDENENNILTYKITKTIQHMVFTSSDITSGTTYKIYTDGTASGDETDGLYAENADYSSESDSFISITANATVSTYGTQSTMGGGFGGGMGGGFGGNFGDGFGDGFGNGMGGGNKPPF